MLDRVNRQQQHIYGGRAEIKSDESPSSRPRLAVIGRGTHACRWTWTTWLAPGRRPAGVGLTRTATRTTEDLLAAAMARASRRNAKATSTSAYRSILTRHMMHSIRACLSTVLYCTRETQSPPNHAIIIYIATYLLAMEYDRSTVPVGIMQCTQYIHTGTCANACKQLSMERRACLVGKRMDGHRPTTGMARHGGTNQGKRRPVRRRRGLPPSCASCMHAWQGCLRWKRTQRARQSVGGACARGDVYDTR